MVPNKLQISNPICTFQLFQVIIVESKQIKMFPSTLKHVQVYHFYVLQLKVPPFSGVAEMNLVLFFSSIFIILGFH